MLLALDTATRTVGIALHDGTQVVAENIWVSDQHHTVELAPEVALMFRRASITADDLTVIAAALGPGSFTGLRIGLALASGLALAHHLPLYAVPTFDILVRSQPPRKEWMLAVIQAGGGRIAGVWYKWERGGWAPQGEAASMTWVEVRQAIQAPTYICGEVDPGGRRELEDEKLVQIADPVSCLRRPSHLAALVWEKVRAGEAADLSNLKPIYLHPRGGPAS